MATSGYALVATENWQHIWKLGTNIRLQHDRINSQTSRVISVRLEAQGKIITHCGEQGGKVGHGTYRPVNVMYDVKGPRFMLACTGQGHEALWVVLYVEVIENEVTYRFKTYPLFTGETEIPYRLPLFSLTKQEFSNRLGHFFCLGLISIQRIAKQWVCAVNMCCEDPQGFALSSYVIRQGQSTSFTWIKRNITLMPTFKRAFKQQYEMTLFWTKIIYLTEEVCDGSDHNAALETKEGWRFSGKHYVVADETFARKLHSLSVDAPRGIKYYRSEDGSYDLNPAKGLGTVELLLAGMEPHPGPDRAEDFNQVYRVFQHLSRYEYFYVFNDRIEIRFPFFYSVSLDSHAPPAVLDAALQIAAVYRGRMHQQEKDSFVEMYLVGRMKRFTGDDGGGDASDGDQIDLNESETEDTLWN